MYTHVPVTKCKLPALLVAWGFLQCSYIYMYMSVCCLPMCVSAVNKISQNVRVQPINFIVGGSLPSDPGK